MLRMAYALDTIESHHVVLTLTQLTVSCPLTFARHGSS